MKINNPRLRKIVRRLNRGVVVGVAIVLIAVISINISGSKLKKEMPELRRMAREYITELAEMQMNANMLNIGESIKNEDAAKMRTELDGIVKKYFSDSRAAQLTYKNRSDRKNGLKFVDGFDKWVKRTNAFQLENFKIVEDEWTLEDGTIMRNYGFDCEQKAGKYLEVTGYFEAEVTFISTTPYNLELFPFQADGYYGDEYYYKSYGDIIQPDSDTEEGENSIFRTGATLEINYTIYLVREGGEWKIASVGNNYSRIIKTSSSEILEGKGDE